MSRLLTLPAVRYRDLPQSGPACGWCPECREALASRRRVRRRRERDCRDAATGALSFGLCGFLLVGPSLLPLAAYLAVLALGNLVAVVAIYRGARRDSGRAW